MIRRIALAAIVALVVAYAPQPTAAGSPGITLVDLGLGMAADVNDRGQIIGSGLAVGTGGFLWDRGVVTPIGALPTASWANPMAINNRGQVVGHGPVGPGGQGAHHAFLWEDGVMTDLGVVGIANDINDRGQIVGVGDKEPDGWSDAFLWDRGVVTYVVPGARWSEAWGINEQGQVVGGYGDGTDSHVFLWQDGVLTDLPPLPGGAQQVAWGGAVNKAGVVVGSTVGASSWLRAVMWRDDSVIDLGALMGPLTHNYAYDVNDRSQVVGTGTSERGGGPLHAFLWEAGVLTELHGFGNSAHADAVNKHGWVVGTASDSAGRYHAVLWIVE